MTLKYMQIATRILGGGCIQNLFLVVQVCTSGDKIQRGGREGGMSNRESRVVKSPLSSQREVALMKMSHVKTTISHVN